MTGLEGRRTDSLFLLHSLHASFLPAAYNFIGHPPPPGRPLGLQRGRTLTLEVKDFRLCRKAAALTFARPCYASFHRPIPHNSFFSEKILSSRLLKLNAHLEKAALERLTFL